MGRSAPAGASKFEKKLKGKRGWGKSNGVR
ncbi:hypothetical protein SAG0070_10670 [Streptococcus agalactiae CCUG 44077]|nr:hypothetical protein SAG0070_10670 [Streptococcus agalactiae CCUG 44077]EPW32995.1 hypothetical protein SAG0068_10410 [Streptococcus agalactiae CCUG 44050]EPW42727.1 hypothetical protein SAG0071_10515 [Streptococcus agalactiae CCUG 44104]